MKSSLIIAAALSTPLSLFAQEQASKDLPENQVESPKQIRVIDILKSVGATEDEIAKLKKVIEQNKLKFQALSEEKQKEYFATFQKSLTLQKENRLAESLASALEAESIYADHPELLSLTGLIYTKLRDLKKAELYFEKAITIDPYNPGMRFNYAEIFFVSGDYQKSLKHLNVFKKIAILKTQTISLLSIAQFKIELCHLALSSEETLTSEEREKHKTAFYTAVDSRDYTDHNPLTYYSKAAKHFYEGDENEAIKRIKEARIIFTDVNTHAAWLDTLYEFGLIDNIYKSDQFWQSPSNEKKSAF